jgi:hypothetical protein
MCSLREILSVSKAAILSLTLIGSLALAEESKSPLLTAKDWLGPSGNFRLAYFERAFDFSTPRNLLVPALWLQLKPQEVGGIRTFAEARLVVADVTRSPDWNFDLREGYAETSLGIVDIRAGRQVIVWGRADKVNPTDSFATRNLRLLTSDDEEQRLGTAALQTTLNLGSYRLVTVWQPEWRRPAYPIPPLSGITLQEQDPPDSWQQIGLKLDRSGGAVDWSVSYATVYDRFPDLSVISAGASGVNIGLNHNRIHVFGADAATTIGPVGIRAEAAYTRTKDESGNDPTTKNSTLYAVLGAEYSLIENLNLNAQYLYRHVFNFVDPTTIADPNTQLLALQTSLLANQMQENQHGASVRLSYKLFHETLEPEVAFVGWFTGAGWLVRPKVTYAASDSIRLIGGAQFFGGPAQSFFGRLQDTSTFFVEARFLF